jgi:hypothetical protein
LTVTAPSSRTCIADPVDVDGYTSSTSRLRQISSNSRVVSAANAHSITNSVSWDRPRYAMAAHYQHLTGAIRDYIERHMSIAYCGDELRPNLRLRRRRRTEASGPKLHSF